MTRPVSVRPAAPSQGGGRQEEGSYAAGTEGANGFPAAPGHSSPQSITCAYIGGMARARTSRVRGSTALTADAAHRPPRYLLGNALRAAKVYLTSAVRIVLLGPDGTRY